jgi:hypothetical protein
MRIDCLLLNEGQLVNGQILKANKMGAYALLTEGGQILEAVRVLLPREFHVGNVDFDTLVPGSKVRIKILKSRFQKSDAFIQAAGVIEEILPNVAGPIKPLLPAVSETEVA